MSILETLMQCWCRCELPHPVPMLAVNWSCQLSSAMAALILGAWLGILAAHMYTTHIQYYCTGYHTYTTRQMACAFTWLITVPDPGKGVCGDPVNKGAILEGGGLGPPGGNKERQLSPDKGRGKTWLDEEMAGSQGRLPLHGFKMRACTEWVHVHSQEESV